MGLKLQERKQNSIRSVGVRMLHNDGIWRRHRGKIGSDSSLTVGNLVWADAADYIHLEPTRWRQFGLTKGVLPVVHVNEWSAIPIDATRNGAHHPIEVEEARTVETPYDLSDFKKKATLEKIRRVGQQESLADTIKLLMYGMLGGIALLLLFVFAIINKLGILNLGGHVGGH